MTRSIVVPRLDGDNSALVAARRGLRLETLTLNIAGGRTFWFRTADMQSFVDPRGLRYFVTTLPAEPEKLSVLER